MLFCIFISFSTSIEADILIRGVNRAKNVTISALRTGVMVASALYDQKIVMDKINILNQTTENIIESTSHMLKEQGSEIQKHSAETMISPEVLKTSFAEAIQGGHPCTSRHVPTPTRSPRHAQPSSRP